MAVLTAEDASSSGTSSSFQAPVPEVPYPHLSHGVSV